MKFEIKNRWTGAVQFECELSADFAGQSYGLQLGFSVKKAIEVGAYLSGANLSGANLSDANLSDANLSDANLSDANLSGANLSDANLSDANLSDANLSGAYLRGANLSDANLSDAYLSDANLSGANLSGTYLRDANLSDANLSGAYLSGVLKLVGDRPVIWIGPIGSESRTVYAWLTDQGLRIQAGCFFGDRAEFLVQLDKTHGDNVHGQEYRAALALIDEHARIWRARPKTR